VPGKMNINTMWGFVPGLKGAATTNPDLETFQALCSQMTSSTFTPADVQNIFNIMTASRTPNGQPGPNDRPFRSFAAAFSPVGGPYAAGSSIEDTILRTDLTDANAVKKRLLEFYPATALVPNGLDHPYAKTELLNKIFNNLTTRSNVFALWLTVGFFEVTDSDASGNPIVPPQIGQEIGRSQGRQIRHRMFALIDRSELRLFTTSGTIPNGTTLPGPVTITPNQMTGPLATGTGNWNIQVGSVLEIDSLGGAETVSVTGVGPGSFTVNLTKQHATGTPISIIGRCNPGPWPGYNPRNDRLVVPYFSIIQ
jgi:hypothetical protein